MSEPLTPAAQALHDALYVQIGATARHLDYAPLMEAARAEAAAEIAELRAITAEGGASAGEIYDQQHRILAATTVSPETATTPAAEREP